MSSKCPLLSWIHCNQMILNIYVLFFFFSCFFFCWCYTCCLKPGLQRQGLVDGIGLHELVVLRLRPGQDAAQVVEVQVQVREGPGSCAAWHQTGFVSIPKTIQKHTKNMSKYIKIPIKLFFVMLFVLVRNHHTLQKRNRLANFLESSQSKSQFYSGS